MRQGNGTDLLGMNDPRSATIGVIYVSPTDDRTSVFAAILTQEKLKREHILIVLPDNNKAFESAQDFDDLKTVKRKLNGDLIFVAPEDSKTADMARQRQFPVYASLEEYTELLREDGTLDTDSDDVSTAVPDRAEAERRGRVFGGRRSSAAGAGAAAGGAALGAAVSGRNVRANPDLDDDDDIDSADEVAVSASPSTVDTPLPQRGASSVPVTPGRAALDDDDALDEPGPAAPISRRSGNAGATGYIPADKLRQRGRSAPLVGVPVDDEEDEDDDWEPLGPSGAASGALAGGAASRAGVPSTPLSSRPNQTIVDADDAPSDIIDLQPVARNRGPRSTLKLNDGTSGALGATAAGGAVDDDFAQPVGPAATPPLRKRRTGSMATAAAGGALAVGAVGASAGSNVGGGGRPVPGSLPSRRALPPNRRRRPSRGRLWLLLLLLLLLTAIIAIPLWAMLGPASFQTAVANPLGHVFAGVVPTNPTTITITPASKTESNSFVVHAVTKNPDATNLQVSMRNLAANPPAQTKTVTGTGTGHTPATYAHGTIRFYSLNTSAITLGAGIVFNVNGIHVVTEQAANIPAAQIASDGSITVNPYTVPAHATTAGTVGNLDAGAISQACCSTNVRAVSGQFIGGQDPVAYTYVQQSDVDGVVNPLVSSLVQQAKTTFNRQLRANERLAGNPQCKPNTDVPTSNIGPQGHRISSVQVTVSASCTGVVYDYQGAQNVTQQRLQLQATRDLGANYKLVGNVIPAIKSVTRQGDNVTMVTNAEGIWVYQFDNSMKQRLAHLLADKKLADAQRLLAQQTGVKSADIKLGSGDTLPTDLTQITIDIKGVAGLSDGNGNGGTPAVAGATPTAGAGKGTLFPFIDQIVKFLKG
jgi:hypothetical protein